LRQSCKSATPELALPAQLSDYLHLVDTAINPVTEDLSGDEVWNLINQLLILEDPEQTTTP